MLAGEPEDVFLNYALAMEWMSESNFEKAEEQLLRTLELNKEYLPCYYQLGQVSEKKGEEQNALDYYKKGAELAKQQNNVKALNELNEAIWMLE